jgi:fumarylacetoacetate (FAA) hydrolase
VKLAIRSDGTRDGQLAVVSRDLKTAHIADRIAPTMQAALDDWRFIAPELAELYQQLNAGRAHRSFDFEPGKCMASLPRAYQWPMARPTRSRKPGQQFGSPVSASASRDLASRVW